MAIATMKVPTIFTATDRFSDVVNTMAKNATKFGNAAEGAASRIGTKMTSMGKSMMTTSAVMLGSLAYPLHKAIEFEDQMASINTLLELNPKGIRRLGDEILNMASKTSTPIEQLTKSYYDLISAGVKQSEAMKWLSSSDKLAITGLGTLPESTDVMLATMRNFNGEFKDTNEAANVLFKTIKYGKTTLAQLSEAYSKNAVNASLLGVKAREYNAAISGMSIINLPLSELENMIGNLSIALRKGKGKLPEIFSDNGVKNANELLKKTGSFKAMLEAIDKSGKKLGFNENKIFPLKGAATGFTILTKNQTVIDKYNESLKDMNNNSNNSISRAFIIKQATGKFGMDILMNNLNALSITVGNDLVPALIELTKYLNPMIKRFSEFIKKNPGLVSGFAKLAVAVGAIGLALNVGGWLLKFGAFVHSLPSLGGIASTAFGTIELWAGYAGMTVGALLGTIALVIAGIGILAWIAIDMFQHWEDWRDIVVNLAVPFGTLITLVEKLFSYSEKIQNADRKSVV